MRLEPHEIESLRAMREKLRQRVGSALGVTATDRAVGGLIDILVDAADRELETERLGETDDTDGPGA
jgi:hypothetical protein